MAEIRYVRGDATEPIGNGCKIVAHVTNNSGGWGRGFVLAVSKRWRAPEEAYRSARQTLGDVGCVWVDDDLYVANMCAQDGYTSKERPVAIEYLALADCLDALCAVAINLGASVHCPRIGCGLGGGDWPTVEALLVSHLVNEGINVTVYDL